MLKASTCLKNKRFIYAYLKYEISSILLPPNELNHWITLLLISPSSWQCTQWMVVVDNMPANKIETFKYYGRVCFTPNHASRKPRLRQNAANETATTPAAWVGDENELRTCGVSAVCQNRGGNQTTMRDGRSLGVVVCGACRREPITL